MKLSLHSRGGFAGEFVIDDKYSIGDYIEATLTQPSYPTGDTVEIPSLSGSTESKHVIVFPLLVEFSSEQEPFHCQLHVLTGRVLLHWYECLQLGETHQIRAIEYPLKGHIWYVPEIDGYRPGAFRKVKT